MSLLALLDLTLLGAANRSALEVDTASGTSASFTFGELEVRSNRLAQALHDRGLVRGDRLAFLLANRVEIIDLWLACVKLGVIVVPINVLYQAREIAHIVGDAKPVAVVTTSDRIADLGAGAPVWDVDALMVEAVALKHVTTGPSVFARPSAMPTRRWRSCTPRARPVASKGAILTHGNFASNAIVLNASWAMEQDDRLLCALPLFHVHGLGNAVHCWLLSGCHMKLVARFEASRAAEWFTSYEPTVFFGVPTMYVRLLELDAGAARTIGIARPPVRVRISAVAGAGAGGVSRALRARDPRALRHDRNADERQQSVHRRAARRHGRRAACR